MFSLGSPLNRPKAPSPSPLYLKPPLSHNLLTFCGERGGICCSSMLSIRQDCMHEAANLSTTSQEQASNLLPNSQTHEEQERPRPVARFHAGCILLWLKGGTLRVSGESASKVWGFDDCLRRTLPAMAHALNPEKSSGVKSSWRCKKTTIPFELEAFLGGTFPTGDCVRSARHV